MPLVFVHGVNVRDDELYRQEVILRNQLLMNVFSPLAGLNLAAENLFDAFWGDLAPAHTPGNIYLPQLEPLSDKFKRSYNRLLTSASANAGGGAGQAKSPSIQTLQNGWIEEEDYRGDEQGSSGCAGDAGADSSTSSNSDAELVALLSAEPLEEVIDNLIAFAQDERSSEVDVEERAAVISRIALRALKFASKFKSMDAQRSWLKGIQTDEELLSRIAEELDHDEESTPERFRRSKEALRKSRLWLRERLRIAGVKLVSPAVRARMTAYAAIENARFRTRTTTSRLAARTVMNPARKFFHNRLSNFVGDAFFYFGKRGTGENPGVVPGRVMEVLAAADRARTKEDNLLIVVAHSMGGIVMCDIVSHFKPPIKIDCLITVGSQFPLFADLRMFPGFDQDCLPLPKPSMVNQWINIIDLNDFLGFAADKLFEDIVDVEYASGKIGVATHADYFKLPSFYRCMAAAMTSRQGDSNDAK